MQSIHEVARDFTALLRAGHFAAAGERFWAADVTSTEPAELAGGTGAAARGIAAVRRKCAARFGADRIEAIEIDEIGIDGPFVTGDQFALFLDLVIADPAGGERQSFTEIALYTVRGGQIAEERYFYA